MTASEKLRAGLKFTRCSCMLKGGAPRYAFDMRPYLTKRSCMLINEYGLLIYFYTHFLPEYLSKIPVQCVQ